MCDQNQKKYTPTLKKQTTEFFHTISFSVLIHLPSWIFCEYLSIKKNGNPTLDTPNTITANPTWSDTFESSKLKARTSLLPRFNEKRRSSFELWALKQHSNCHPKWDGLYIEQIELPAKLLDYFLWSNKSNINQYN